MGRTPGSPKLGQTRSPHQMRLEKRQSPGQDQTQSPRETQSPSPGKKRKTTAAPNGDFATVTPLVPDSAEGFESVRCDETPVGSDTAADNNDESQSSNVEKRCDVGKDEAANVNSDSDASEVDESEDNLTKQRPPKTSQKHLDESEGPFD
jgi:hypothetical protein